MQETGTCSICDGPYTNFGNNPEPLASHDLRVCDECNAVLVIPARLGTLSPSIRTLIQDKLGQ